jgi:hypothetical protein
MSWKYNKTPPYVKRNFAKLNVYFEALNYETVEQKKAYEVPGLLGDIGGQMGLFIGASILTILELFDYVYEVIKVIVNLKTHSIKWFRKSLGAKHFAKERRKRRSQQLVQS